MCQTDMNTENEIEQNLLHLFCSFPYQYQNKKL